MTVSTKGKKAQSAKKKKKASGSGRSQKKSQPHASSILVLAHEGLTCREGGKACYMSSITISFRYLVLRRKIINLEGSEKQEQHTIVLWHDCMSTT